MNHQKKIFIFLGPPGSGKGSLSQECTKRFGWRQCSTGSLCRKHIIERTELGQSIDFAIKCGKLISDDLIVAMVQEWIIFNLESFDVLILDGFPRTVSQAEALHAFLFDNARRCALNIIKFFVSDETVMARLAGRLMCETANCQAVYSVMSTGLRPMRAMICDLCYGALVKRDDDSASAIQDRLRTYHIHEQSVVNFYKNIGCCVQQINVEKPLDRVFEDFKLLVQGN